MIIKINVVPQEIFQEREKAKKFGLFATLIIIAIIIAGVMDLWAVLKHLSMKTEVSVPFLSSQEESLLLSRTVASLDEKMTQYDPEFKAERFGGRNVSFIEAKIKDYGPIKDEFKRLKPQIEALVEKKELLEFLNRNRIKWSQYMEELMYVIPERCWLERLHFSDGIVRIGGKVEERYVSNPSASLLSVFMQNLQASALLKEARQVHASKVLEYGKYEVRAFDIECKPAMVLEKPKLKKKKREKRRTEDN